MRATLALLACCIAWPAVAAAGTDDPLRERCSALINLFDEVIVSRFDYRILMLEDYELDDARDLRRAAEVECAAGSDAFGVAMIASALRQIGVVPPWPDAVPPHD